jgi:hypothetical protein
MIALLCFFLTLVASPFKFGLGCQRRRSLTSQSEIIAGAAAKSE